MLDFSEKFVAPGHEQLTLAQDAETGVWFIVSIHNTKLGPALGGCRMIAYPRLESAIFDVLRLSEGMTYKNSLAGLNIGGGKSVIIADRALEKGREQLFRSFGNFISSLEGRYYTAEDMGTSVIVS